jgi:hypothetical protein
LANLGASVGRRSCETPAIPRRRLFTLAFVVTTLLAVVAVAARGRPLGSSGGSGSGLPLTFWDYVFTSFLIIEVFMILAAFAFLFLMRRDPDKRQNYSSRTARALAILIGVAVLLVIIGRHVNLERLLHPNGKPAATTKTAPQLHGKNAKHRQAAPRHVQFRWEELAIVLGLLLGLGVLVAATRGRLLDPDIDRRRAPEVLAAALDESLDDLRADPDLRRAIIAAYARMETALAAAGLPRHRAEAPLEYVERALLTLDTSASAVRRLTDLFQWARFSQHEPDPGMRDEAVDALIAVRDELRASELTLA